MTERVSPGDSHADIKERARGSARQKRPSCSVERAEVRLERFFHQHEAGARHGRVLRGSRTVGVVPHVVKLILAH